MQPEISHRCESCGASIREQAMFCPECGQTLTQSSANIKPPRDEETPKPAVTDNEAAATRAMLLETANVSTENQPAAAVSKHGTYEKARDSLHRASSATREALADNVKRVEKIRHVSSVVLEEATYDPSLRFVLVALGIFVVFLVLLLLSKVMG